MAGIKLAFATSVPDPGPGYCTLYSKSDGKFYFKGPDNIERPVVVAMPADPVTVLTISSGVVTIDLSAGRSFTLTLNANVTSVVFTNMPAAPYAAEIEIVIAQDATGARSFALPTAFKALGGSDTSIGAAANQVTVLSAKTVNQGTTWYYGMQERAV